MVQAVILIISKYWLCFRLFYHSEHQQPTAYSYTSRCGLMKHYLTPLRRSVSPQDIPSASRKPFNFKRKKNLSKNNNLEGQKFEHEVADSPEIVITGGEEDVEQHLSKAMCIILLIVVTLVSCMIFQGDCKCNTESIMNE